MALLPTDDQDALRKRLRQREHEFILEQRENARRDAAIAAAALIGDDGLDANGHPLQPPQEEEPAEVVLTGFLDKKVSKPPDTATFCFLRALRQSPQTPRYASLATHRPTTSPPHYPTTP